MIFITSYNRPRPLLELLGELKGEKIIVIDDGSDYDSTEHRRYCDEYIRTRHHGRKEFWNLWQMMFDIAKRSSDEDFIFLQDDLTEIDMIRLRRDMSSLRRDPYVLNLLIIGDRQRWRIPYEYGYVDCIFATNRITLDYLQWRMKPISPSRFLANPNISTGVGRQLSKRFYNLGIKMIIPDVSYVVHGKYESQMNPMNKMIDNAQSTKGLVAANFATYTKRINTIDRAVESIIDQVDIVRVHYNDYIPEKRRWEQHSGHDYTDRGKFAHITNNEIAFFCDDDILYPPDYVEATKESMRRYSGYIVTYHGTKLLGAGRNYYKGHKRIHFRSEIQNDEIIDVPGSGVCALDTAIFKPDIIRSYSQNKMADILLGYEARKENIPIICLKHSGGWLSQIKTKESIFGEMSGNCTEQNRLADLIYKIRDGMSQIKTVDGIPTHREPEKDIAVHSTNDKFSIAIMADERRRYYVDKLTDQIGMPVSIVWERGLGRTETGLRAWKSMPADSAFHLVIQDDAIPMDGLLAWIKNFRDVFSNRSVSLYMQGDKTKHRDTFNAATIKGASWIEFNHVYWGVALSLPAVLAKDMMNRYHSYNFPSYDMRIDRCLSAAGIKTLYPIPSPVDHRIDTESLIWSSRERDRQSRRAVSFAVEADMHEWNHNIYSYEKVGVISG